MKILLTFVLIGLVAAGCASSPTATPVPATAGAVARTPAGLMTGRDASSSQPLSVTANPPRVQYGSTPGAPAGWQTFTSQALGLVVDFPADWTASEEAAGVQFRSPQGATISLAGENPYQANSAGFQCSNLLTPSGMNVQACGDPVANRYYAALQWTTADGSSRTATLSTRNSAALEVYRSMLASLRLAQ